MMKKKKKKKKKRKKKKNFRENENEGAPVNTWCYESNLKTTGWGDKRARPLRWTFSLDRATTTKRPARKRAGATLRFRYGNRDWWCTKEEKKKSAELGRRGRGSSRLAEEEEEGRKNKKKGKRRRIIQMLPKQVEI